MHPLSGQTIVFLPGMDGTGISFEPLGQLLPKDVIIKMIQYPTDKLLSFEDTVRCAKDQIQNDQGGVIVLAESFSGPVAVTLIGSGQLKAKCLILCSTRRKFPLLACTVFGERSCSRCSINDYCPKIGVAKHR